MARQVLVTIDEVSHLTEDDWAYLTEKIQQYVDVTVRNYALHSSIVDNDTYTLDSE